MADGRRTAYETLYKIEKSGAYSNLSLNSALSGLADERERAFATALVYGTLENKEIIDVQLNALTGKSVKKMQDSVRVILRMAVYQLVFMDKVPDSAAVNEAVKLSKKAAPQASGFVNGVLRTFIRNGKKLVLPEKSASLSAYLAAKYSCPCWIVDIWLNAYGEEKSESILKTLAGRPPVYVRVNTAKTNSDDLTGIFEKQGVKAKKAQLENALEIEYTGAADELPAYKDGLFHVQDIASQICCSVLNAKRGQNVYDVCAAPGGKTMTIAEMMENEGEIVSCDIYENRVKLIKDTANRLGLDIVAPTVRDAREKAQNADADAVLCDVPCSGLGIIRRKPDIKSKTKSEISDLPALQREILCAASGLVKKGGTLVYSTCTLNPVENEENIEWFLSVNEDYEPYPFTLPEWTDKKQQDCMATLFPNADGCDGFFIARMRRKG